MGCNFVAGDGAGRGRRSFSILYRIEWVVTEALGRGRGPGDVFQYPVSDRMGCNWEEVGGVPFVLVPFSILYRIEWVVTPPPPPHSLYRRTFQYPVSDRMGCNACGAGTTIMTTPLSVSCIGSNGL